MHIESITNIGLHRDNNEDRFLAKAMDEKIALLVIADGMGGHAAGEIAAEIAVGAFEGFCPAEADTGAELVARVGRAQEAVIARARAVSSLNGMGTTLTALVISGQSAFWAHVGDTRIYLYRKGGLLRITEDHTVAGMLLKDGKITREQARVHPYSGVLTRCVGCEEYEPDTGDFELARGDLVFLSTDGLHDLLPDESIASILGARRALSEKLTDLVAACLKEGGRDNITAIIAGI